MTQFTSECGYLMIENNGIPSYYWVFRNVVN